MSLLIFVIPAKKHKRRNCVRDRCMSEDRFTKIYFVTMGTNSQACTVSGHFIRCGGGVTTETPLDANTALSDDVVNYDLVTKALFH